MKNWYMATTTDKIDVWRKHVFLCSYQISNQHSHIVDRKQEGPKGDFSLVLDYKNSVLWCIV